MHMATYIVLNAYRKYVSTAEYDQTQAITTMAKAAVYGVQAFLVRLCNDRDGMPGYRLCAQCLQSG
jgi:hypothetical protein